MGRKTKKEKIIADLRRQLQNSGSSSRAVNNPTYTVKLENRGREEVSFPLQNNNFTHTDRSAFATDDDRKHIKFDMVKTVLFTVFAIGAQIVLWYVLNIRK